MRVAMTLGAAAVLWTAQAAAQPPIPAQAAHAGCEQPPTVAKAFWYFDPAHGDDVKGDGSAGKPWMHISALFAPVRGNANTPLLSTVANPGRTGTPPVNPGDALVLKSGNYGDVTIGSTAPPHVDLPQWISITADVGARPVFHSIFVSNTERWAFSGFEVQSGRVNTWTSMVEIVGNWNGGGPTHDIAFTNLTIDSASEADWRTWTTPDAWEANTRGGFSTSRMNGNNRGNGYCVSLTNSHIQAVGTGALVATGSMLVQGDEIDHFVGDGIDLAASDALIADNKIHDVVYPKNGLHTDGIQGQAGAVPAGQPYNTFSGDVIDGNWIQALADPWIQANPALQNYLQGITGFDANWSDLQITNNIVVTHGCWAIWFGSIHSSLVANNTVAWDGLPGANCYPVVAIGGGTHQGPPSSDSIFINNLGPALSVRAEPGIVWDRNVCVSAPGANCLFTYTDSAGRTQWISKPGTYAGNTLIDDATKPGGSFAEFALLNNQKLSYDLHLAPDAQARLWGTMAKAPVTTFGDGQRAINPGAY